MALIDIYKAVRDDLTPRVTGTLASHFGKQWIMQEGGTPRMVWCPTGTSEYSAPMGQGGDHKGVPLGNPAPLWTCNMHVDVHLWASDVDANGAETSEGSNYAATELLRIQFIQSVHQGAKLWGSYNMITERWIDQEGSQVRFGGYLVVTMSFRVPMPRETDPTSPVLFYPATYSMKFPDGTVVGPNP